MTTAISRLHAADFEEALDVLNLAFGKAPPRDFEAILPALYRRGEEEMSWNFALRERGRIRAVVGLFPLAYRWGGATLRVAGIGGVSCHPHARGRGYMQQLMDHCVQAAPAEGFHLSWLGGQRQRYGYFGYEKCGVLLPAYAEPNQCAPCLGGSRFRDRLSPARPQRPHASARCDWPARRPAVSRSARPSPVLRPAPELGPPALCGPLARWPHDRLPRRSGRPGRCVTELLAVNEGEPELDMAAAWVQRHGDTCFELPPWSRLLPKLAQLCEGASASSSGNWQIFDWATTLDALLKTHAALMPLMDGAVVVEIEGYGRVALEVRENAAQCVRTEAAPALQIDGCAAMRLLCGPLPPSLVLPLPAAAAPLEQWCPLPLFLGRQDAV